MDGESPSRRIGITLKQLEVFVALALEGSTRAAAYRVARSQSAASSALAELEHTIGCELFDRVGRRLLLNDRGQAVLQRAIPLLDQAAQLQDLLRADLDSPLRLTASMTVGEHLLPPMIEQWKFVHVASPVRLLVSNTAGVVQSLVNFEADLGFVEGQQTHPEVVFHSWVVDDLVIVCSPEHELVGRKASRGALRSFPWALREPGSGTREATERWLREQLGQIDVAFEVGTPEAIKRIVRSGAALGFLPRHAVAEALRTKDLAEVSTGMPPVTRTLWVAWHRHKRMGSTASSFLQHCFDSVGVPAPDIA